MNILVEAVNGLPRVLRIWADEYTLPESEAHLALNDAADALDDALDILDKEDQ